MRSVVLAAVASVFARALAGSAPIGDRERRKAAELAFDQAFPDRKPKRASDAVLDPYFGIKTKGRSAARVNFVKQQEAFAQTAVGQRLVTGRRASNPKDACLLARQRRDQKWGRVAA